MDKKIPQQDRCVFEFSQYDPPLAIIDRGYILLHHARESFALGSSGISNDPYAPTFPAMTLIQQSFELYFKTLLCLHNIDICKHKHHDLKKHYNETLKYYPGLRELENNTEVFGLLSQLSHKNFIALRYGEGALCFHPRHSGRPPLEVLNETLLFMKDEFEKNVKSKIDNLNDIKKPKS